MKFHFYYDDFTKPEDKDWIVSEPIADLQNKIAVIMGE